MRIINWSGHNDKGADPIEGQTSPNVEPIPDGAFRFPGFIRENHTFQHPHDSIRPMQRQIDPGRSIFPLMKIPD